MELDCPRCTIGKLEEIEIDEILIDRCKVCGGFWFDQGELAQMVGADDAIKQLEAHIPEEQSETACPRCDDAKLRRQTLCQFNDDNVDIYRCPSCLGTWIDRGVLRKSEDPSIAKHTKNCFSEFLKK